MSDRELLEKAAKAAGIEVFFNDMGFCQVRSNTLSADPQFWNPLHDDGDALRLAVRLDLDVLQAVCYREAQVVGALQSTIMESWGEDKSAATRRAIVRAAAALSESKGE